MAGRGGKGAKGDEKGDEKSGVKVDAKPRAKRGAKRGAKSDAKPDGQPDIVTVSAASTDTEVDGQPDAKSDTGKKARRKGRPSAFPLIALALAVALIGIGIASYFAANVLSEAVRAAARRGVETPAALATTVCGDLIHQNYSDLVARVDPTAAPPAATGPFDAGALTQRLHTLDQEGGPVVSCSAAPLAASDVAPASGPDGATRLLLTLWRAGTPQPISAVLITRQSLDGAWVVERDSSFLLAT